MATVVARANFKEHWQKPPTAVYNDNYGYAINYYQPMIDYLDLKRDENLKEDHQIEPPHLPWLNERGLAKYRPGNEVRNYPKEDLVKFAVEAERKAKENLQHFKVAKRTDLTISGTVKASKVAQEVVKESKVKQLDKSIHNKIMEAVSNVDGLDLAGAGGHVFRNLEESSAFKFAKDLACRKSAKAIEAELLNETFQNLSRNTGVDIKSFQRRARSVAHDHTEHTILMNSRHKQQLEDDSNLNKPITDLKKDLESFKKSTDSYFLDNRYFE